MATKRFINSRYIRHPIFCIISFVSGIVLASWLMCSDQGSPKCDTVPTRSTTVYYNETYTTASQDSPVEHTSNKSTVLPPTREPYPPLINKKDLLITPRSCPENLFLLILVVTSSRNFEARKAIRRSWGEDTSKKNESSLDSFRVVYVVGSDGENDRLIKTEAKRYRDMLRGGFNDVYRQNNEHTVKALFGFKWAMTSCKAKFILRASSDTFVNVPEITSFLKTKSTPDRPASGIYMGFCHGMSTGGANVVRNPGSQWYISEEEWPDTYLPPYASSMGILFTYDVVDKIASLSVKVSHQ